MFFKLCVVQFVFVIVSGVNVKYLVNYVDNYKTVNSSELTSENLGSEKLHHLRVLNYNEGDEQIDSVSHLPNLEIFEMETSGQEYVPDFEHLPKLAQVHLSGNKIKYLKKQALKSVPVEFINMDLNLLETIEKKSFGNSVKIISLRCNRLTTFSEMWFNNISALEEVEMGGNLLTFIGENAFKNFPNLNKISFSYNQIKEIGKGALSNINRFHTINFAHNLLKEIRPDVFVDGNFSVLNIFINNNRLTFLSPELLQKMEIRSYADIDDNPWQCKCWEEIKLWIPKHIKIFKDSTRPSCVVSLSFNQFCVPLVEQELIDHFESNLDPVHYDKNYYCS